MALLASGASALVGVVPFLPALEVIGINFGIAFGLGLIVAIVNDMSK